MPANPLINNKFIDSCAFDPKYEPEDRASIEIFKLSQEGKILIKIAHSTQKELEHPNTPAWVKHEAHKLIYTIKVPLIANEESKLREIETILAGNGKVENILQDARHIFEAQKYGSYFITTDARILNRAQALRLSCGVTILKPSDFLSLVTHYLNKENNEPANVCSSPLPKKEIPMRSVPYKGYTIDAAPYKLADSKGWSINIYIRRDTGDSINTANFSAANIFETEEEAIKHCIDFGCRIIDGEIENCSVRDL